MADLAAAVSAVVPAESGGGGKSAAAAAAGASPSMGSASSKFEEQEGYILTAGYVLAEAITQLEGGGVGAGGAPGPLLSLGSTRSLAVALASAASG